MHYSKKLKNQIRELQKENSKFHQSIWWAKTAVLGKEPGIRGFNSLTGSEEGAPLINVKVLRKLILDLPL